MIRFGKIEVTGGFLLLLAWLNYLDRSFLVPMAVLACAAHELGHFFVIHALGISVKRIRLTAIGAEMVLAGPMGYWQEGVSALAGPGVNLVLALIFSGFKPGLTFSGLNLMLALFNMLPVGRLDGGRALRCTLAMLAGPDLADWFGKGLDRLCAAVSLVAGVWLAAFGGNVTLLLVSLWLMPAFFVARRKF